METTKENTKYIKAQKKVTKIKKFYTSCISYVLVIGFLAAINFYTSGLRNPWFLWAAFGWGIGLAFQAAKAFGYSPIFNKDWEERKIKSIMDKEENENR